MKCEHLTNHHNRKDFHCGDENLNRFLQQFALQHSKRGIAKTHVLIDTEQPETVLGFYSLSTLHIEHSAFPLKGYPRHLLIPAILIGRLAVDCRFQGKGYSKLLLAHALHTILKLSLDTGIACVVIDAKTDELVAYYERLGFKRTTIPYRLVLPLSTLQKNQ
ncbi:hypothetical protein QV08_06250 [Gallibacterium salpingitidis]|uniref:N-acetyltransferase domain-containing protein n=1 Tax=Gallibacterium salpingitidis TaxID=505341 RepID=A0AB36E4A5_9PAST|nr:hypothetical protein QV08_06250 [Gallibacterium salpingitidis]OBX11503.1 hypothetical protein QV09_02445 [Gallibacterium salpingitidis]